MHELWTIDHLREARARGHSDIHFSASFSQNHRHCFNLVSHSTTSDILTARVICRYHHCRRQLEVASFSPRSLRQPFQLPLELGTPQTVSPSFVLVCCATLDPGCCPRPGSVIVSISSLVASVICPEWTPATATSLCKAMKGGLP
jgi:hypothetical protein